MIEGKETLLHQLDAVRDDLWRTLEDFEADREIYPGWTPREFFAHIGGWEAMVYETLRAYTEGRTPKSYSYRGVDEANAAFVAARASLPLDDARLECEINRFAIKTLLNAIPESQFQQPVQFPWGFETLTTFLQGAIDHERTHLNDILSLKNAS